MRSITSAKLEEELVFSTALVIDFPDRFLGKGEHLILMQLSNYTCVRNWLAARFSK
jgi:hypothetical protein